MRSAGRSTLGRRDFASLWSRRPRVEGNQMPRKTLPIHRVVKERLGYDGDTTDQEFVRDWRARTTQVCKPCWELKYCPYGPLVEQSPLLPVTKKVMREHREHIEDCLRSGQMGELRQLGDDTKRLYEDLVSRGRQDPRKLSFVARHFRRMSALKERAARFGGDILLTMAAEDPGPSHLQVGELPFPMSGDPIDELDAEGLAIVEREIQKMERALTDGFEDGRRPLTPEQRRRLEAELASHDDSANPEPIPDDVSSASCNVFGHVCPVFFVAEYATETAEFRKRGRHISFTTQVRVVRRDNYTCQHCGKHLRDFEVEFDHIIPISRGGSSEEHNLRLTCFLCNREKGDSVAI
jgi:hypothetical protein